MKFPILAVTSLLIALLAGCATDYCAATETMSPTRDSVEYLADHDRPLLEQLVVHNETRAGLCGPSAPGFFGEPIAGA